MDTHNAIHWSDKKPDGTCELKYLGNVVGWVCKAKHFREMGDYIAMSVNGNTRHVHSQKAAKTALMEMYC